MEGSNITNNNCSAAEKASGETVLTSSMSKNEIRQSNPTPHICLPFNEVMAEVLDPPIKAGLKTWERGESEI